jgi:hypothetical protein
VLYSGPPLLAVAAPVNSSVAGGGHGGPVLHVLGVSDNSEIGPAVVESAPIDVISLSALPRQTQDDAMHERPSPLAAHTAAT